MRILLFGAAWCKPCKEFKPIVEKVCSEKELPLKFVDVDEDTEATSSRNVKGVPTLIILDNADSEIFRVAVKIPEAKLRQALESLQ